MNTVAKLPQGTMTWFGMVGTLMCDAASRAGLATDLNWLVERYSDGVVMPNGRVQGIRFDIVNGAPSFTIGVGKDESGDVTIEVAADAALELNLLYTVDPAYVASLDRATRQGQIRVQGDLSVMADWLTAIHDTIVDRTC